MDKVLKWVGIVLGGLIGLLIVVGLVIYIAGGARFNKKYDIQAEEVSIPTDAESIALGEYLVTTRGCMDCHGENLGGTVLLDDPALATLPAPNLTSGAGGIGGQMSDEQWVLAIRHGVGRDGHGLIIMPSAEYWYLSDRHLGAIIAYLKQAPPVDSSLPARRLGPMGRLGILTGMLPPAMPDLIDHTGPRPPAPEPGVTVEYGEYVTRLCTGCHGPDLAGAPPDQPGGLPYPNLTPAGELGNWTEEDFITAMRTGVKPSGAELAEAMPWRTIGQATDEELKAIWLYLESLPPIERPGE